MRNCSIFHIKCFFFLFLCFMWLGVFQAACSSQGTDCQRDADCPRKHFCDRANKCNQECESNRDCSSTERCNRQGRCEREKPNEGDAGTKDEVSQDCKDNQTKPCYEGPVGTAGTGACQEGTQICKNGVWGACTGAVAPQTETCNGKDDDCDGTIDEEINGCGCKQDQDCPPERSSCRGGRCILLCQSSKVCPDTERCASGFCQACPNGTRRSANEVCDGKDNNCNGQVDENIPPRPCYTGPASTKNVGTCSEGKQYCQPSTGTWDKCVGEKKPSTEICDDGQDNDCDGTIDTDCNKLHRSCKSKADCSTGQICLFIGQQGTCYQECTNDKNICSKNTDGRSTCKQITNDGISVCAKIASPNQRCDILKSIYCADSQICSVRSRTCITPKRSAPGNICDGNVEPPILCVAGATCINFPQKKSRCMKSCTKDSDCPGGNFKCLVLKNGGGACLEACQSTSGSCRYSGFSCRRFYSPPFSYACLP